MTATLPPKPKRKRQPHHLLKDQCHRRFKKYQPAAIWHGILAGRFGNAGWPDVDIFGMQGITPADCHVEFKTGRDKVKPEQSAAIARLEAIGRKVFVIRSVEEFERDVLQLGNEG